MTIALQRCAVCGTIQYPRRAICRLCLSDGFTLENYAGLAALCAAATVHRSLEPDLALLGRIGTIVLPDGTRLIAQLDGDIAMGAAVSLDERDGPLGRVIVATAAISDPAPANRGREQDA